MVALAQDLPGLIGARLTGGALAAVPSIWLSRATQLLLPNRWLAGTRPRPGSFRRFTSARASGRHRLS